MLKRSLHVVACAMALAIALLAAWVVFLFEVDMRWHRARPLRPVALPGRLLGRGEAPQANRPSRLGAEFRRLPTAASHLSAIEYSASRLVCSRTSGCRQSAAGSRVGVGGRARAPGDPPKREVSGPEDRGGAATQMDAACGCTSSTRSLRRSRRRQSGRHSLRRSASLSNRMQVTSGRRAGRHSCALGRWLPVLVVAALAVARWLSLPRRCSPACAASGSGVR